MKRVILLKYFIVAFAILMAFLVFDSRNIIKQAKQWGARQCYVKISDESPIDDGSGLWRYVYRLDGYSGSGAKRLLEFKADRILRRDAYLRVYVRDDGAVVSWEEVARQDVPAGAQKYLN
ncbi:YxeA family protein [Burkholderia ubonensis]|uniref:YxeA family protein n=1 Tax=Burkholderia ubonensis TaxID=101571 RepID=UPI000A8C3513|nr:YxeA family protein [Burkholderia ubonensis]